MRFVHLIDRAGRLARSLKIRWLYLGLPTCSSNTHRFTLFFLHARICQRIADVVRIEIESDFAARFRLPVGTFRDCEPASATVLAIAYIRVFAQFPDMVAKAVA